MALTGRGTFPSQNFQGGVEALIPSAPPWSPLNLRLGGRPQRLFEAANRNFSDIISNFPDPLRSRSFSAALYSGTQSVDEFEGLHKVNPVLAAAPWLFWDLCQAVPDEAFIRIATAGSLHTLATIILDHLVDGQSNEPELDTIILLRFNEHARRMFMKELSGKSAFWELYGENVQRHQTGLLDEWALQQKENYFAEERFLRMCEGKVSPVVTTIAGYLHWQGDISRLEKVTESLNAIAVASQLLDDIGDWHLDLQEGHKTYFLSELFRHHDQPYFPEGDPVLAADWITGGWLDVEMLNRTKEWFDQARVSAAGLSCQAWDEYIQGYYAITEEHLNLAIAAKIHRAIGRVLPE